MAAKVFPWLSEIEPIILNKIDQRRGEAGQNKWNRQELSAAFNSEQQYLWERISSMDKDFNLLLDDTITVAAGAETTALPADCRVIRQIFELSGGEVVRGIDIGAWHEMGGGCDRDALYRPYPQADLFWVNKPKTAMTLRIVYGTYPPHLFHGCVQGSGASILQVEDWEPASDDVGLTRDILIYEGIGAGTERTVSDYSGSTREATVSVAWSTLPSGTSRYTSRPDLPPDSVDAFIYGVCARLVEKLRDSKFQEFTVQRGDKLNSMYTGLGTFDRRGPLETYDDDDFGHGEPADWVL